MKSKKFDPMIVRFLICVILFGISFFVGDYSFVLLLVAYLVMSYDIYLEVFENILKFDFFDEGFLMVIATIGAICIGDMKEAVMVFFLYQVGEYFGDKAVGESKKSIVKLLSLKTEIAHVKMDDHIEDVSLDNVKIDNILVVKKGETVPVDGVVVSNRAVMDTSSITGESVHKIRNIGDEVLSGFINVGDAFELRSTKVYKDSTISRILKMVEESEERKTKSERFISKFAKIYTPCVVLLAVLITVVPLLFGGDFSTYFYRSLIFLVISCPCALVISVPLSFFCGIGAASKKGILFKGSNELEEISKCDYVLFDKTGTLTKGNFVIKEICGDSKDKILKYAAYAEYYSIHPIASLIKTEYKDEISMNKIEDYQEIVGNGVKAKVFGKEVLVGNAGLLEKFNVICPDISEVGTKIFVALDGKYLGCILVGDEIKNTTVKAIKELKKEDSLQLGILSGDNADVVSEVAKKLKISNYYSSLLPQEKMEEIKKIQKQHRVIFIGDGVNDALALQKSDIGISMGGVGSDIAIEASDVVFMDDDLTKLCKAIYISKKTRRIVWQNIIFSLSVKFCVMILGVFGVTNMWMAIFADVGVTFLAILNSLRIFYRNN